MALATDMLDFKIGTRFEDGLLRSLDEKFMSALGAAKRSCSLSHSGGICFNLVKSRYSLLFNLVLVVLLMTFKCNIRADINICFYFLQGSGFHHLQSYRVIGKLFNIYFSSLE